MPGLRVVLFGAPRLERDGVPVVAERRKALALLAYLAVTPGSHGRDALATLLWPEQDQQQARASVRHVLVSLNAAIGQGWLSTEQDQVELPSARGLWVDVSRFRALLAQVDAHKHPPPSLCDGCLTDLTEAMALYRGDFLAGFTLRDTAEFDAWQSYQTESLRQELAGALERLAQAQAARRHYDPAISTARRWLALDPLCEPAHRTLMQFHAWAGDRAAALHQYEECVRVLAEELDLEPEPETTALYDEIRGGAEERNPQPPLPGFPSAPPHNLPPDPTPFVGREVELAQAAALLADPGCRLLTMVGPGGIGKTRLAVRAAAGQVDRFAHGVFFVDLAPAGSPDALLMTLLRTFPIPQNGAKDPRDQLLEFLRDKEMLLVLDNFEHLLPTSEPDSAEAPSPVSHSGLLLQMLHTASRLKVLVTSRTRLRLREEWLAAVDGLEVPVSGHDRGEDGAGARSYDRLKTLRVVPPRRPYDLEAYSATSLFLACVRRLQPGFHPTAHEARQILHICRLLGGMPLGIELAAARTRTLPIGEIARGLEDGLSLLSTTLHDVPARHRSMVAAFDHSWRLLSPRERSILRQMSVFRGGCTREATAAVTGATLADLENLADASWLQVEPEGRYGMHELVRQYCAGKLADDHAGQTGESSDRVRDRHAAYYHGLVMERQKEYAFQPQAVKKVALEFDNVLAGWEWSIKRNDFEAVEETILSLAWFSDRMGWWHVGRRVCQTFIRTLTGQATGHAADVTEKRTLLLALLWIVEAGSHVLLGQLARTEACLKEAADLLGEESGGGRWRAEVLFYFRRALVMVRFFRSEFAASYSLCHALLSELEERRYRVWPYTEEMQWTWQTELCMWLVNNAQAIGWYDEAATWAERCIALSEKSRSDFIKSYASNVFARFKIHAGDYSRLEKMLKESLRISHAYEDRYATMQGLLVLGQLYATQGHFIQAQTYCRRSLSLAQETGLHGYCKSSLQTLGDVELALGHPVEARRLFEESMALTEQKRITGFVHDPSDLIGMGRVALAIGEPTQAAEYFQQVLAMVIRTAQQTANALAGMAQALYMQGQQEQAAEIVACVVNWPGTPYRTREDAQKLLRDLAAQLPAATFAEVTARGRARQPDDIVAELAGTLHLEGVETA